MTNHNDVDDLAYDFVFEYLDRNPEITDVSEYVWDNAEGDVQHSDMDSLVEKVYRAVATKLTEVRDNF